MTVEDRHSAEADPYREATELYAKALHADYHISLDAAHEIIKAALAEAKARGAAEEREACILALEKRAEQPFRDPLQRTAYRNAVDAFIGRSE